MLREEGEPREYFSVGATRGEEEEHLVKTAPTEVAARPSHRGTGGANTRMDTGNKAHQ